MKRILKTPLVWFVVIGAALFAADELRQNRADHTIRITQGDIQRIRDQWQAQSGSHVTREMLDALIQEQVQERRLYREALALGLAQDDVIVRRRLAQKLRFLTEDLAGDVAPDSAELERYFREHREHYKEPARISFHHVYFSSETRGERARADATAQLSVLAFADLSAGETSPATPVTQFKATTDWLSLGDPFMLGRSFHNRSVDEIERQFGPSFATALKAQATRTREPSETRSNRWGGPIQSSFGIHLVSVDEFEFATYPKLNEVRDRVVQAYRLAQRKVAYDRYLATLADKYPALIEPEALAEHLIQTSSSASQDRLARTDP